MCAKHTTLHSSTYTQREAEPRGTVVYTHTYIHTESDRGTEDKGHREVSQEVQSTENSDECGKHRLLAYREKAT